MMHTMERYFTNGGNMEITDAIAEGLLGTVMDPPCIPFLTRINRNRNFAILRKKSFVSA